MNKPFVTIMMGSDSDMPVMQATIDTLNKFGVKNNVYVCSAHRTPEYAHTLIKQLDQEGCGVFIAAAGMAAHLAGAVAANTLKPVIGVPINASLDGLDALLSTVQMPGGIPVATVAIGKAGAKNAAYLAMQMLSLNDGDLAQALKDERESNARAIIAKNK